MDPITVYLNGFYAAYGGTYIPSRGITLVEGDFRDGVSQTFNQYILADSPFGGFGGDGVVVYRATPEYSDLPDRDGAVDTFNFIVPVDWTWTESYTPLGGTQSFQLRIYDETDALRGVIIQSGEFSIENACFTRGTMIATPDGLKAIETLVEGDLVLTRDHGAQPVRWIGASRLTAETLEQFPAMRPIRFAAGALGANTETLVSPHHRMALSGWRAEALFGQQNVLVAAKDLVNDTTIRVDRALEEVEYVHILFDRHEIIQADGAWSESFHPSYLFQGAADTATRDEVLEIFPELERTKGADMAFCDPTLTAADVTVLVG